MLLARLAFSCIVVLRIRLCFLTNWCFSELPSRFYASNAEATGASNNVYGEIMKWSSEIRQYSRAAVLWGEDRILSEGRYEHLRSLLIVKESISKRPNSAARCIVFLLFLCGDSVVPMWQEWYLSVVLLPLLLVDRFRTPQFSFSRSVYGCVTYQQRKIGTVSGIGDWSSSVVFSWQFFVIAVQRSRTKPLLTRSSSWSECLYIYKTVRGFSSPMISLQLLTARSICRTAPCFSSNLWWHLPQLTNMKPASFRCTESNSSFLLYV